MRAAFLVYIRVCLNAFERGTIWRAYIRKIALEHRIKYHPEEAILFCFALRARKYNITCIVKYVRSNYIIVNVNIFAFRMQNIATAKRE